MTNMTEKEIDDRWPVLAQVVRAIEWHGEADYNFFCHRFTIERDFQPTRADAAEAEMAKLTGSDIVKIMLLDPDVKSELAPNACAFLTSYCA